MKMKTFAALAAIGAALTPPLSAAELAPGPVGHQVGAVAGLRLRLPLGPARTPARLGLALNSQHRYVGSGSRIEQFDIDGLELGFSSAGPRMLIAGTDVARLDERFGAGAGDETQFPWKTVGLVLGAAALAGGIYVAHIVHESNENSE